MNETLEYLETLDPGPSILFQAMETLKMLLTVAAHKELLRVLDVFTSLST